MQGEAPDPLPIKISGGTPPLTVMLNGLPLDPSENRPHAFLRA